MINLMSKVVKMPFVGLADYLIKRFIGKFVDEDRPIRLDGPGCKYTANSVTITDINLNCKVSNLFYL